MLLLSGVSGISYSKDSDNIPVVDFEQFKTLCYTCSKYIRATVLTIDEPKINTNFYNAELKLNGEHTYILLNCNYPFLAFATDVKYFNIKFIDPMLSSIFKLFSKDYKVLTSNELNETLYLDERTRTVNNENSLNQGELDQIFYWKPKTVGEVVFNYWD